jgi:streptomycin 6-kinase
VSAIHIPSQLADAVDEDDSPARREWLARLPAQIAQLASEWELELGEPYLPGGQCAWVAPARDLAGRTGRTGRTGDELVLKVGWRHREAAHEADALRFWGGDGAVRCFADTTLEDTTALLLERCVPGHTLGSAIPEGEQDVVVARILRRLWEHEPPTPGRPFASLQEMCDDWATSFELGLDLEPDHTVDPGRAREALAIFRELPDTADRTVVLCTDLHAGNILAARREPWLVIDPKPFVGDPAYDVVQHMLNCDERLARDPETLARRMADLLDLDRDRVSRWLFARCAQESLHDPTMREPARRLAP